jgi:hypothetical protein
MALTLTTVYLLKKLAFRWFAHLGPQASLDTQT